MILKTWLKRFYQKIKKINNKKKSLEGIIPLFVLVSSAS